MAQSRAIHDPSPVLKVKSGQRFEAMVNLTDTDRHGGVGDGGGKNVNLSMFENKTAQPSPSELIIKINLVRRSLKIRVVTLY